MDLPRLSLLVTLLLAGCVDQGPADEPAADAPPANGEAALVQTPLAAEGATEGVVCGPLGCRVAERSQDVPLPTDAPLRRIEATFTWTPRDPTMSRMEVFLLRITPEGWEWEETPDTYWVGASPLAVTSNLTDAAPQEYMLHARVVHQPAPGVEAGLSQTYRVEGVVSALPSPS